MRFTLIFFAFIISLNSVKAQDYFLENNGPYDNTILSPEQYLGYEIGFEHTRHDLIVAYLKYLENISEKAQIIKYGETHEGRDLVMLTVSSTENLNNLENIKVNHLKHTVPGLKTEIDSSLPIIVNLGYGVHGNEPSSAEAALLSAYTLVASNNDKIKRLIENSVIFIDPTLLTSVIIFFSTTISTGPFGGEPSPLIKVTPLIISCSYGPSPKYFSCEKLTNTNKPINKEI